MDKAINWIELQADLVSEFGYSKRAAERAIAKLQRIDGELFAALSQWLDTGALRGPERETYTLGTLVEHHGMTPPAAFLAMDWLGRDPKTAVATLNRRRYDAIRPTKEETGA